MPTTAAKRALFETASAARSALRGAGRAAATRAVLERAAETLGGWPGTVGLYVAIRDELNPIRLAESLAAGGRDLALPCTPEWGRPMVFRRWSPGDPLVRGRMNVPEPAPDADIVVPDAFLVPPVAFDRRCFRIGYGAGFYDRTLAAVRTVRPDRPVRTLGIAFACQEVSAVPDEPHDIPLDAIATEHDLFRRP
ncbi:5-formyltetrahydrofolate cyclo-ligase [Chthonobacter albigriseus]|uniref:5-formyltetrahydrofolate cyclo-ligase n=1 Tax=Chthonobacter albigriseus TaxID=1683161 RepID=UPI0015EEFBB1|nr:5-formyltetrahydrofolate cyclo-ligase [Chthonobacter albigriseus]